MKEQRKEALIKNLKDVYGFTENYYRKRFIEIYQERPGKDKEKFEKFKKEYKKILETL